MRGLSWQFPGAAVSWHSPAVFALAACATVSIGFAVVQWPWVASGAVFGLVLLAIVLFEPLALIALMLALGPVDLSFVTGGFKTLFQSAGGLDMNGIRLIGVSAGLLALILADARLHRVVVGPAGRWYLLFLLWAAFSLTTTFSTVEGLRLLLKIAYPFLTFVLVAGMAERGEQLDRLMTWTLLAGAVIMLLINPVFVFEGGYLIDHQGYRRVGGVGAHQNPFSFYLTVVLLISFARFLTRGQLRYLALCGMASFWIALTLTRITVAGLFAAITVMSVYAALAARNYRALIAGGLVCLGAGSVLVPPMLERSLGFVPTPGQIATLVRNPQELYGSINWQGREVLWPIVYHSFRQEPWTGLGIGSSTIVLRKGFTTSVTDVVHNEYLRLAADTGLIGIGLYFTALMAWFIRVARLGWRASARTREYAVPALGVLAAWGFIALTDNAFDYYASLTQYAGFLCGGAFAAARLESERAEDAEHARLS